MAFKPHFELLIGKWWSPETYTMSSTHAELRERIKTFAAWAHTIKQPWRHKLLFSIPNHARLLNRNDNYYTFAVGQSPPGDMMLKAKLQMDEARQCVFVDYSMGAGDKFNAFQLTIVGCIYFFVMLFVEQASAAPATIPLEASVPLFLVAIDGIQRYLLGRRHSLLQDIFTQQLGLQPIHVKR